jgi:hypothetical protein
MSRIGAQILEKARKEVTNGPYWCPYLGESEKRGHQWTALVTIFERK